MGDRKLQVIVDRKTGMVVATIQVSEEPDYPRLRALPPADEGHVLHEIDVPEEALRLDAAAVHALVAERLRPA